MTLLFDQQGRNQSVTILEVGPCVVTQIRRQEKAGYNGVELGFGAQKESRTRKAELGLYKKIGTAPLGFRREVRTDFVDSLAVGDTLFVDQFKEGEYIDVIGTSIGKGFQGVVKRHHFKGGPRSHGSMFGRAPGSIGASSFPSRVMKGMRAAGHMGHDRVTVQNLRVFKVDRENHLLSVIGSVPGPERGFVMIRTAIKTLKERNWDLEKIAKKSAEEKPALVETSPPSMEAGGGG